MDNRKPIHHFSIPENEQFDMDATTMAASITRNLIVQRVKQIDRAIMDTIREAARLNGITDVYLVDEDFVVNALKRQIPMDPDSSHGQWSVTHYCPMCGNILKAPTLDMFKNGSYCDKCGQKIQWGDCSD